MCHLLNTTKRGPHCGLPTSSTPLKRTATLVSSLWPSPIAPFQRKSSPWRQAPWHFRRLAIFSSSAAIRVSPMVKFSFLISTYITRQILASQLVLCVVHLWWAAFAASRLLAAFLRPGGSRALIWWSRPGQMRCTEGVWALRCKRLFIAMRVPYRVQEGFTCEYLR